MRRSKLKPPLVAVARRWAKEHRTRYGQETRVVLKRDLDRARRAQSKVAK